MSPLLSTRRLSGVALAWALTVVLAAGLGWWAGRQATRPPQIEPREARDVTAEVVQGTVQVEQSYGIEATWPSSPVGVNGLEGTLTSIGVGAGEPSEAGDVAYSVDLQPVVILAGKVPAFRELSVGVRGEDVRQLEQFLAAQGYLSGQPDDRFNDATGGAVAECNADIGAGTRPTVPLGQVVFVAELPATLVPAEDVRVGARVTAGQDVLAGTSGAPQFSFRVLPEAVTRTSEGMQVSIDAGGTTWSAEVDRLADAQDDGGTIAVLRPTDGQTTICGSGCSAAVDPGATTVLPGRLVVVPKTEGAQVPTAAIHTDAQGESYVTLAGGQRKSVEVLASSEGRSIVTGVTPGQTVVVASSRG